jgi:anti-sigma factor RsiW
VKHIAEDSLQQYAMGAITEPEAGPLQEHLLICPACPDRLQSTDDYVAAIRAAAQAPVKRPRRRQS